MRDRGGSGRSAAVTGRGACPVPATFSTAITAAGIRSSARRPRSAATAWYSPRAAQTMPMTTAQAPKKTGRTHAAPPLPRAGVPHRGHLHE